MTMVEPTERVLSEGTPIEVRNRFDARWNRGFVIDQVAADGYRIRRSSDDQLLPTVFTADEIRREHRRGQWWY
ncbi:MAG TPA: hypothetical protein VIT24_05640 [Acidimicrobiales bacterium]